MSVADVLLLGIILLGAVLLIGGSVAAYLAWYSVVAEGEALKRTRQNALRELAETERELEKINRYKRND